VSRLATSIVTAAVSSVAGSSAPGGRTVTSIGGTSNSPTSNAVSV